jgi:carbon monoxide dehydrogenase subunit G
MLKQLPNLVDSFNPLRRRCTLNPLQQFGQGNRFATRRGVNVSFIAGVLLMSAALLPSTAMAATTRVEIRIAAPVDEVWAAVRDVGAVHTRLAPGFVVDDRLENGVRTITFANGLVIKETIVSIDDENHRLGYSALGSRSRFHFASIEVVPDGEGSRMIWIADALPDDRKGPITAMMEQGAIVMKKTLEEAATRASH